MTISNNKVSHLVSSQLPFFVRNDHPNFVAFLEAYYRYLEQNGKAINEGKTLLTFQDIDLTEDEYADRLYSIFMKYIPVNVRTDRRTLLKHIKDFYRSKGTEASIRFLMNAFYDIQNIEFYYPKKDILRVSDGKWFIQRSIRIDDIKIDGISSTDDLDLEKFIGIKVTAQTSKTVALVERVDRFFEEQSLIKELILSNIDGKFKNSEVITGKFYDGERFRDISAVVYNFVIDKITITNVGSAYNVNDPVIIQSNTGNGACVVVGSVSGGEITNIIVLDGGSGYQVGDNLSFTGTTVKGIHAQANVITVSDDNLVHPNTYSIDDSQILLAANNIIGNVVNSIYETYSYSNLATQLVTVLPNTSNLYIQSSNITLFEPTSRFFRANIRIGNNSPIVINTQPCLIRTVNTQTDVFTVHPGIVGNSFNKSIQVYSYRDPTNLYVNTGVGSTNTISLLQLVLVSNVSNIRVARTDVANTLVLTNTKANSNVYFATGYSLNIDGVTVIVTGSSPLSSAITTTPELTGTLTSNTIFVYEPQYIRANAENSNVFITTGNVITVGTVNAFISQISSNSNVVVLQTEVSGSLTLAPIKVFRSTPNTSNMQIKSAYADKIYLSDTVANSNVFFRANDRLNVNGVMLFVNSISGNNIVLYPGMTDGNTKFDSFIVYRTPFNSTSNLKVSTGAFSTNQINITAWKANSNVFFETGDSLDIDGSIVTILSSNTLYSNLIVYPEIAIVNERSFDVIKKPNVNTVVANSLIYFTFNRTGPITEVRINNPGGYVRTPTVTAIANTKIRSYGILGALKIVKGGSGYSVGDQIEFINVPGGVGSGAAANVRTINATGAITSVQFTPVSGESIIGGSGYDSNFLPIANIISTGTGAQINVSSILGSGATFRAISDKVGAIKSVIIRSRGAGYEDATANLTFSGDGTATANVSVVAGDIFGVYAYPGRWLNDDGHISSANYIQDRDYYQIYSYVIRSSKSISVYRKPILDLTHPAGSKLFGEYLLLDQPANTTCPCNVETVVQSTYEADPVLILNFRDTLTPDANLIFTRTSSGTYVNAKGYIATASANVARYTHNPVSLRREGVLFEGRSTNLALYSEDLDNAYWSGRANVSVSSNTVVAPNGTLTADLIVESSNNSTHNPLNKIYTVSANTPYTGSLFVKKSTNRNIGLFFYQGSNGIYSIINLSSGIITSNIAYGSAGGTGRFDAPSKIEDYGNDWYRVSITGVGSNNSTTLGFACYMYKGSSGTYQGDGVSNVAIWGVQLERRDLATSYIPTGSATVTRNSDTATINLMSLGISTANGFTLQSEAKYYDTTGYQSVTSTISLRNTLSGVQLNYIGSRGVKGYTPQGYIDHLSWNGATSEVDSSNFTVQSGEKIKTALSYQNNNVISLISNNTHKLKSTDSSVTLSNLTQVTINREVTNDANGVMTIEKIKLYDRALSNSAVYQIIENP